MRATSDSATRRFAIRLPSLRVGEPPVGRIEDLERQRVERFAVELVPRLRERGELRADTAALESVERWRAAARRAGRLLGWRVRTGVSHDGRYAWAVSEDWPVPPGEYERAARQLDGALFRRGPEPS
jgi:hypothetical protein